MSVINDNLCTKNEGNDEFSLVRTAIASNWIDLELDLENSLS